MTGSLSSACSFALVSPPITSFGASFPRASSSPRRGDPCPIYISFPLPFRPASPQSKPLRACAWRNGTAIVLIARSKRAAGAKFQKCRPGAHYGNGTQRWSRGIKKNLVASFPQLRRFRHVPMLVLDRKASVSRIKQWPHCRLGSLFDQL